MKISSKEEMYKKYWNGEFGNKLKTWTRYEDIINDGFKGLICIRIKSKSGHIAIGVSLESAKQIMYDWVLEGVYLEDINFNEMAPDNQVIFQGEMMVAEEKWHVVGSRKKNLTQREAVADGEILEGMKAKVFLKHIMTPSSFEDFATLLEKYPNSVIEFGVYEVNLGSLPNRNTIIWEVRNY